MRFRIPDFVLGALLATLLIGIGLPLAFPDATYLYIWFAVVLLVVLGWALISGVFSTRRISDPNQHIPHAVSPDVVALIQALRTEGRANRREEQREDRGQQFRDITTIILLALTVVAVFRQIDEMVKVYKPIKNQAEAATTQADAAKAQAKVAQESVTASTRAWVGPANASIVGSVQLGQPAKVKIGVFNTGKEPAKAFSYASDPVTTTGDSSILAMDINQYVSRCFATLARSQAQVLYPSSGFGTGFEFTAEFPSEQITSDVISGKTILLVRGCLTYQTGGVTRHSSYCYFFKAGTTPIPNLNICASGSDAD